MNLKSITVSGIKWTIFGTVGRFLFQLLQVAVLTRFLSKEAFGLVAMSMFVIQFTNIFSEMGLTTAILHRQNATQNEYSSIYWLNIMVSLILFLTLILCTPFVSRFYNEPSLNFLIPILGTNILFLAIGRQHRTIMQKQFRFKAISVTELIAYFIGLVSAIVLAINDYGILSLVYSTLISSLISGILFLIQNLHTNPIKLHFKATETLPFLKIGGFSTGSSVLDFFSREIDILIVGKMLGTESLGIYSLTKQIAVKLFHMINPLVFNVLSPILSTLQNEKERLRLTYLKLIRYLSYINFTVFLIIVIASREILSITYGTDYSEADSVLMFLAFACCISSISNPVGSLQIATGRTDIGFKWTIIRVSITPIFIFVGSLYNITAVAALYAILSVLLTVPMWYIQLLPMANISLSSYVSQFIRPFLFLLTATMMIYYVNSETVVSENVIIWGIIKSTLSLLIFGTYLMTFDRKSVTGFIRFAVSGLRR